MTCGRLLALVGLCALLLPRAVDAAGLDPHAVAVHVDELLAKESFGAGSQSADTNKPAAAATDQIFLRRLSLDLVGRPPSPEEVTAFSLDTSADKRAAAVERLLADKAFGENWARYWRDVIMYRRSEDRALLVSATLGEVPDRRLQRRPALGQDRPQVHHRHRRRSRRGGHGHHHGPDGQRRGHHGRGLADLPGHPDSMRPVPQPSDRSLEARAVPRAGRVLSARSPCGR